MARFVIVYASTTGNTKEMADAILEGARSLHADAKTVDAYGVKIEDLLAADAIGIGSPTFEYDVVKQIKKLMEDLSKENLKGKLGIAFGSYGWSGEAPVIIAEKMREMGIKVIDPVIRVKYKPTENELDGCKLLGKDVAVRLKKIKAPRARSLK